MRKKQKEGVLTEAKSLSFNHTATLNQTRQGKKQSKHTFHLIDRVGFLTVLLSSF